MQQHNARKFGLKSVVILAALSTSACVGMPKPVDLTQTNLPPAAALETPEQSEAVWQEAQVLKYTPIWNDNSEPNGDAYTAGKAAYYLSIATDEPEWSKAAIKAFEDVNTHDPIIAARARAALGASHRMAARNFPIKGVFQYTLFGTPGLKRASHVKTAISLLNKAVEESPNDPVIRQYRATAFVGIPKLFGVREEGLADFEQLSQWTQNPELNGEFAVLLTSPQWQEEFFMNYATASESVSDKQTALENWKALSTISTDPYLTALAIQKAQN